MKKTVTKNGWIRGEVMTKNILLGLIVSACTLTACSGGREISMATSNSRETVPTIDPEVFSSEADTSLAEETKTPNSKTNGDYDGSLGPLTYSGSVENGFTIYQYDINSGSKNAVFSFENHDFYTTTVRYNAFSTGVFSSFQSKSYFSEDMTKFAVSWTDNKDSSLRVGWIDKDGRLTDVTKVISPPSTEFSSIIPKDGFPQFTPDGNFMFVDYNSEEYVYVDVNTLEVVRKEKIEDGFRNGVMILPNGKKAERVFGEPGCYNYVDFGDYKVESSENKYGPPAVETAVGCDFTDDGVVIGIGYKDQHSSIAKYGPGFTQPVSYHQQNRYESKSYVRLTPTTDYNLEACAYNNGRIAFIGNRGAAFIGNRGAGGERYLFVIDDGEGEQSVKQVTTVPWDEMLLFWR